MHTLRLRTPVRHRETVQQERWRRPIACPSGAQCPAAGRTPASLDVRQPHDERRWHTALGVQEHTLGFEIFTYRLFAVFTPDARVLESTERRQVAHDAVGID